MSKKLAFRDFSFGEPFLWLDKKVVVMEIDCKYLIDGYEYHDAPSTIDVTFSLEDLTQFRSALDEVIKSFDDSVQK